MCRTLGLPLDFALHTGSPHYFQDAHDGETEFVARRMQELEEMIDAEGADTIGAMIVEPVMGAGGVILHPKDILMPANDPQET